MKFKLGTWKNWQSSIRKILVFQFYTENLSWPNSEIFQIFKKFYLWLLLEMISSEKWNGALIQCVNLITGKSLVIKSKHIMILTNEIAQLFSLEIMEYLAGVQMNQSYCMERRCLFSLGWPPFSWWYHNKSALWVRCFISLTSVSLHLFLLGLLKVNLILSLDQLRLT